MYCTNINIILSTSYVLTMATKLCIRFDFSWCPPTDGVHKSWKVKLYHVSPSYCGCGSYLHIYIIWFMIYLFLLLRLPEKRKEWIQTLFIFYPWFFYCIQRIWLFQKMPRKVCTMYVIPHQHIYLLYTYIVLHNHSIEYYEKLGNGLTNIIFLWIILVEIYNFSRDSFF